MIQTVNESGYLASPVALNDPDAIPLKVGVGIYTVPRGSTVKHLQSNKGTPQALVRQPDGRVRSFHPHGEAKLSKTDVEAIKRRHKEMRDS